MEDVLNEVVSSEDLKVSVPRKRSSPLLPISFPCRDRLPRRRRNLLLAEKRRGDEYVWRKVRLEFVIVDLPARYFAYYSSPRIVSPFAVVRKIDEKSRRVHIPRGIPGMFFCWYVTGGDEVSMFYLDVFHSRSGIRLQLIWRHSHRPSRNEIAKSAKKFLIKNGSIYCMSKKKKKKKKEKKEKRKEKGSARGHCVILRNVLAAFCCRNSRMYITSKCVRRSLRKKRNSNMPGALWEVNTRLTSGKGYCC